jgi:predicted PurR-regulated permease PerM
MKSERLDRITVSPIDAAAWILAGFVLLAVLGLHLLGALFAGLLVYELVHILAPYLPARLAGERAKLLAVGLLATVIVGLVVLATIGVVSFLRSDAGSVPALLRRFAEIVEAARASLPPALVDYLPATTDALHGKAVEWLHRHAGELQLAGKEAGRALAHVIVGLVIGALIALHEARPMLDDRPLARSLVERASRLGNAFRNIVFAQVRISAVNTTLTAVYLMAVLPQLDIHLPLAKTMVAITFVAGLLPVIGNLISNTVIVVVSLAYSAPVAVASLAFLVVIHKLEYFLNARIVGARISARAWELLLAMLVMEAAFGLAGLVAAPVYYAYLKDELAARDLI